MTRARRARLRRSQATVEVVLLVAVVALAVAFVTGVLPKAIKKHYAENRDVLASPL